MNGLAQQGAASLPLSYYLPAALLVAFSVQSLLLQRQLRHIVALTVYGTIILWYMLDPLFFFNEYSRHSTESLDFAFLQVSIFVVTFRILLAFMPPVRASILKNLSTIDLDRGGLVKLLIAFWLILFLIGLSRVGFDVRKALLPIEGRATWTAYMWHRPRFGSTLTFLVSVGENLYTMTCTLFGLIFVISRNRRNRQLMFFMMLLTWPMFMFTGTRSLLLTVVFPSILAAFLTKNWSREKQIAVAVAAAIVLNLLMLAMLYSRNVGVEEFADSDLAIVNLIQERHLGRNMTEELIYVDRFISKGAMPVRWGGDYLDCALNFIPRSIWKEKPMPGEDFAELRVGRYKQGARRGELIATVSRGIIGQGVCNFGPYFGPAIPAVLLVIYFRWVLRLLGSGHVLLRVGVVFASIGQLPNLGREITLFSLWPVVFLIMATFFYERNLWVPRRRKPHGAPSRRPPQPVPVQTLYGGSN